MNGGIVVKKTQMTTEKKYQLKRHANRKIELLLAKLGIAFSSRENLIQACCPCKQHGGDGNNPTSFSWRPDIGYWICWTHHCEEKFGNDIFGLVRSVTGLPFDQCVPWIIQALKNENVDVEKQLAPDNTNPRVNVLHVHDPVPEHNLKFLKKDYSYPKSRGLDPYILEKYQSGVWSRIGTYMHDRFVLPIRDHQGFVVGFTGRTLHEKEWFESRGLRYVKWIHGRHFDKFPSKNELFTSSILFNLNNAQKHTISKNCKKIIIVEGPFDGIKLEMAGIQNWVATLGTTFSAVQKSLLIKAGITDIFVAYDNDKPINSNELGAGDRGYEKIIKVVGDFMNTHRVQLTDKDPGEMSVEEIKKVFGEAKC